MKFKLEIKLNLKKGKSNSLYLTNQALLLYAGVPNEFYAIVKLFWLLHRLTQKVV